MRRRGASQWAQLTARSLVGLLVSEPRGRHNSVSVAAGLEVAVHPERDDGWHGAGDEAKLLPELRGRGPEATLTFDFTLELRSSQPHGNDVARQSALFHGS